jgi:cytoskeletal protein RodZ
MALNGYNDDPFDQDAFQAEIPPELEPEKPRGNRTFLTVIIALGIVFLLALLGLLIFAPRLLSNQRAEQMEEAAQINAANTATAVAVLLQQGQLDTQQAQTKIASTLTAAPTKTAVVAVATHTPQATSTGLSADELATVEALQTQLTVVSTAYATPTVMPTALPDAGFMDDIGLPTMAGLAVLLIVIIAFSRRLRLSSR